MIVSPGSTYTDVETGRVVEVFALTPFVLYSPRGTYDTEFHDSSIFQMTLEEFLLKFTDNFFDIPFGFGALIDGDGAIYTDGPGGPVLYEVT